MSHHPASRLSQRATTSLKKHQQCSTSPHGYVSLGLADNSLMQEQLLQRMNTNADATVRCLSLGDTITGPVRLKTAIARFFNHYFHPAKHLQPSQLITTNGVTSAIEHCSWAISFGKDVSLRPAAKLVPVSFEGGDPLSVPAVSRYEDTIVRSGGQGCPIRAIMLCNSHNPLGRCYSRDEIYALSVWRHGQDETTSVLSIETDGIIDPSLVQVLWCVSKEFGSNGLRLEVVISPGNPDLLESVRDVGQYSSISGLTDSLVAMVLEDEEFMDGYTRENGQRLAESYAYVVTFLDAHGIPFARGSNAAFDVWCDLLTPYLRIQPGYSPETSDVTTREASGELMQKLNSYKLHLGNGDDFGGEQPGWFRITFSQHREQLDEGLQRIVRALHS
ncbi:pyridoxal phosphate-dependent aminotransferase [Aspergillus homomorphus CBS 101889]|uniref:Putative aspartate aminotransferase n=1 Tax=Aspergillus homomorphus (strain CBS 101889) TaxID=1450537 RepID=A0A395HVC8_ASPHC|nr:putative aspartate aminotransferase [Aspergillus homomorphus CBS 101889]RAL10798.1 putative aspartate aminotransferase [Aspergillus homomorphus CBS 101889]